MKKKYKYQSKNILILGFSKTGKSIAKFLKNRKCKISFWDDNPEIKNRKDFKKIEINNINFNEFDYIFVSPGISKEHILVKKIISKGIRISSDIELFFYHNKYLNIKNKLIAITGTNGKSTVAMMIARTIKTKPLGNFGNLVLDYVNKKNNQLVLELSSFQLDYIDKIKPNISVITNIKPDHISHHVNFSNYKKAKYKITAHQNKNDYLILNYDDSILRNKFRSNLDNGVRIIWVSKKTFLTNGISIKNKRLFDNYFDNKSFPIKKSIFFSLNHNMLNLAISYACLRAINIKTNIILNRLFNFKGLPHRLELVGRLSSINFYNDSKATNVAATCSALESFEKVILIAGGSKKGENFSPLKKYIKKIFAVCLLGDTAKDIADALNNVPIRLFCKDMNEAVKNSYLISKKSKINYPILLSPASASFDLYDNYKKRGDHFKSVFKELLKEVA